MRICIDIADEYLGQNSQHLSDWMRLHERLKVFFA